MLRNLKDLERYTVTATDGDVGSVVDFLLDDERWTVRYLVVRAGGFFGGREVLVSPAFFREAEWSTLRFHLALTREKVKNSPSVEADSPVSRRYEHDYYRYYDYPYYWGASGVWGVGAYPTALAPGMWKGAPDGPAEEAGDAHLRSGNELTGYHLRGSDGAFGRVADFLVDDGTWQVRYLVVDTGHWWAAGKKVLVAPSWATSVDWPKREVHVDLARQAIRSSPTWDATASVGRDYESRLHEHYRQPAYWVGEGFSDGAPDLPHAPAPSASHQSM
jgi:PRC-barrel domain